MTVRNYVSAFAVALAATALSAPGSAADRAHPLIVELFQSQGCSSCPPANANVIALGERPDLLTLSLGVTYWDQLGWKDSFASPQFTARQWDYAHAFHRSEVFTPEVVVGGRADVVGNDRAALDALIARESQTVSGPRVDIHDGMAVVGAAKGETGSVWLLRYDPDIVWVPIKRGENEGRTLPHKNVVRELVKLGEWSGRPVSYPLPAATAPGLRDAVLVQAGPGGAILADARD